MIKTFSELNQAVSQYLEMQNRARQLFRVAASSPYSFDFAYDACLKAGSFLPSQKRSEIMFLCDLVQEHNCKTICEIGTFRGGTLFMLCQAAPSDAKIVSVDINSTITRRHALRRFPRHGQKLKLIVGDSHSMTVERQIKKEFWETGLDFLFIDGDHSLFGVLNDFVRYSPLVKPGGIIALHDIHQDSILRTGVKTKSYVGGVPFFWDMIQKQGFRTE